MIHSFGQTPKRKFYACDSQFHVSQVYYITGILRVYYTQYNVKHGLWLMVLTN